MFASVPAFAKKDKFADFRSADPPAYHVPVRHILSIFENRIKGNNMSIINDFKNEFRSRPHEPQEFLDLSDRPVCPGPCCCHGLRDHHWSDASGLLSLLCSSFPSASPTSSLRSVVCMTWAILATGISPSWLQACLPPLLIRSFPLPR